MNHNDLVSLIRAGIPTHAHHSEIWADVGAGSGNFTLALHDLLGDKTSLIAIDHDQSALAQLSRRFTGVSIHTLHADFTQPLDLPPLDGMLMANALHFVQAKHQSDVLRNIVSHLKIGATFIIVEYELHTYRPWIPHPVPFDRFQTLASEAGLSDVKQVGFRRSPTRGDSMYAASAIRHK